MENTSASTSQPKQHQSNNKKKNQQHWKDKRDKKRQKKENKAGGATQQHADEGDQLEKEDWGEKKENYEFISFKLGSPKFDEYYKVRRTCAHSLNLGSIETIYNDGREGIRGVYQDFAGEAASHLQNQPNRNVS